MNNASRWLTCAAGAVIVVAALAAYHNSFSSPFVFDDSSSVTENLSIRQLWPPGPVLNPPADYTVAGRPLANLSFALNYAVGGRSVRGYHVVNLALHALTALVLFGTVRRTLRFVAKNSDQPGRVGQMAAYALPIALAVAVIWTVHPLLTGTVSYVSQRTELMMAFFYLLTLYAFVRGIESGARSWLLISVVACVAGVASKEVTVTAPLLVMLYDWAFVSGSLSSAWRHRRAYYLSLAAMSWGLLAVLMADLDRRAVGFGLGVSGWNYALTECKAVLSYLRLTLWPFPLVFDYGQQFLTFSVGTSIWALALAASLGVAVAVWINVRRVGFLMLGFFIVLAPTSSFVPVAAQPIAENRAYLPSAFAVTLLVVGLFLALGRKAWPMLAVIAVALGWSSVQRNDRFRDKIRLWEDTVAKAPSNARAYENLGEAQWESGNIQVARKTFETALRLQGNYPEALNNYAVVLQHLGDFEGARRHFETALRFRPNFAVAHDHLGNLLMQLGMVTKAQEHFEAALAIRPHYPAALNNLGNALLLQGQTDRAQRCYEDVLRVEPDFPQAHLNLGVILRQQGRTAEAKTCFERAVRLAPTLPEARLALGVALLEEGKIGPARSEFEMALTLRPNFPEAHNNLGNALIHEGRLLEARGHFEEALRLRPNYRDAQETLLRLQQSGNTNTTK